MPEHTKLPPVLQALGQDLITAMQAVDAAPSSGSARQRLRGHPAITSVQHRRLPTRWGVVGITVVGAAVVALILGTTGKGPAVAFAGWSATTTSPASGQLQAAEAACQQQNPSVASLAPTVADTRGPYSMLVWANSSIITNCTAGAQGTLMSSVASAAQTPAIAPDAIEVESSGGASIPGQEGQTASVLDGQVGADVTAVTLVLDDGTSIQTTVANGWFAAWWPGSHGVRSAEITTASGITTHQLNMSVWPQLVEGASSPTGGNGASTSGAPSGTTPKN